jgi:mannitol/fructose-specific phosphotransferase system IIA component (Ntr-type)
MRLKDLMTKNRIETCVRADNWRDVVKKAGALLLKDDLIEERYINAMIATIEKHGPYVLIGKGIALLHARPSDGSKVAGISLITLDPPVSFGHKHHDPVKVAISFCTPDSKSHLEALSGLMKILREDNSVERIYAIKDKELLYRYICSKSEINQEEQEENK